MRILFFGDVFGKVGRELLARHLPALKQEFSPDLVLANGENASGGIGLNDVQARELLDLGIQVLTGGNHSWKHKAILPFLDKEPRLLRPANFPAGVPGRGMAVVDTPQGQVAVISLLGRIFMEFQLECPFLVADRLLNSLPPEVKMVFVDFHAEATAEKLALARYLDGRVSAVVGTHTHVQTADACLLPGGTAYLTDAGMTGPHDGVIGMQTGAVLERFLTQLPTRFEAAEGEPVINGAVVDIDPATGHATAMTALRRVVEAP